MRKTLSSIIIISSLFIIPMFIILPMMEKDIFLQRCLAILSFTTSVFLINYFVKKYRKIVLFLLVLAISLYCLASMTEFFHYYMTRVRVNILFWKALNIAFIKTSITTHVSWFVMAVTYFISLVSLWVFLLIFTFRSKIEMKNKNLYKKVIKLLGITSIIIFSFIVNVRQSSLVDVFNSYGVYKYRTSDLEYLTDPTPFNELVVGRIENTVPKNVVHIILESYADIFVDPEEYPNLTPNLNRLSDEGVRLKNMEVSRTEKYSYAGLFLSNNAKFAQGGLGDNDLNLFRVLKKAGYTNVFIRGAEEKCLMNTDFIYGKTVGCDEVIAKEFLAKKYSEDFVGKWGYQDQVIFEEAYQQYKKLSEKENPFSLTLFTLDTHGKDQDVSDVCKDNPYEGEFDDLKIMQGANCTDYLLNNFINRIKELPNYKNTIIVIHADHMPWDDIVVKGRTGNAFGLVLNHGDEPFVQEKKTYLQDVPMTIIKNINLETNAQFFLGEDVLSEFTREVKTKSKFGEGPIPFMSESSMSYLEDIDSQTKYRNKKIVFNNNESYIYKSSDANSVLDYISWQITGNEKDKYELCYSIDYRFLAESFIGKKIRGLQNLAYKDKCFAFKYHEDKSEFYLQIKKAVVSLWKDPYIKKNGKKFVEL